MGCHDLFLKRFVRQYAEGVSFQSPGSVATATAPWVTSLFDLVTPKVLHISGTKICLCNAFGVKKFMLALSQGAVAGSDRTLGFGV
jgi:hypothetical protein